MWVEISKLKNYKFLPGSNKFILELINLKKNKFQSFSSLENRASDNLRFAEPGFLGFC